MTKLNRRQILAQSSAVATCAALGVGRRAAAAPPSAEIHETKVISHLPHRYHAWPTVARRRNGQLLVVCTGGRERGECPFGRIELMRSDDGGKTWSWPRVVMDGPIDDRDAGVLETAKGTILVTTFTSLAYVSELEKAQKIKPGESGAWPEDKLNRWQSAHNRVSAEHRRAALNEWMIRSTDDGVTFSGQYPSVVNSPHGPIQLADGRVLYAGKELWHGENRVGVCESKDDGQSWQWLAEIPTRDGDSKNDYHELHAVEAADGRIVAQIRNHNKTNYWETLQSESSDGGKTWSEPHSIGVWGFPSHLLRLKDDRLLMSYGHRRAPMGNQARVSEDHGRTWSDAIIISGDGVIRELGYPSTVQLDDGSLVTVWYENMNKTRTWKESPYCVLRQAHWSLGG